MLKFQMLLPISLLISTFLIFGCHQKKESILFLKFDYTSTPGIDCDSFEGSEGLYKIEIQQNEEKYLNSKLNIISSLEDTVKMYHADVKQKIQLQKDTFCLNIKYLSNGFDLNKLQIDVVNFIEKILADNENNAQEINELYIPYKN